MFELCPLQDWKVGYEGQLLALLSPTVLLMEYMYSLLFEQLDSKPYTSVVLLPSS